MKKSSFAAMVMGTISGAFFALGMCMALITSWNAFVPGIVLGVIGIAGGLITTLVWRRMERKPAIKLSGKVILTTLVGIIGALGLGVGMTFTMVWGNMILGIIIGIVGILILMTLIPLLKGLK